MPTSVIEQIRGLVRDGAGLRDEELLGRFIDRRDEAAVAALVKRHGPMVWGVCRRHLSHHDAEEAFQATFVVLVRKASSIANRETLGTWLYGVAHQTALQARRTAARRRAREVQVVGTPDTEAPQDHWADVRVILDEELSRLPDPYRAVIVLSDLEDKSRKEVAAALGCPEGTVASRLARAREMLAKRLARRGIALSGGALAAVLSQNVAASSVPASVAVPTIKAAALLAAGQAGISTKVAALAEGVLNTMLLTKLKNVMVVLVATAIAGALGFGFATAQQKDRPAQKAVEKRKDETVKEKEAIAWGKEVDGLQIGLADVSTVRHGETMKLVVKLRNVGKAEIKVFHGLLQEFPPQVDASDGGRVSVFMPPVRLGDVNVKTRVLEPGETITLYNPEVAVKAHNPEPETGPTPPVGTPTIRVRPWKYKIAYSGMIRSHPKLATGTVEFEVKAAKESATAWGKEVDGVQVGIQFGEDRVYKVGETVTLIVRLRNNGKKAVPFRDNAEYFYKNPPLITGADGKAITIQAMSIWGFIRLRSLAPGKEIDLIHSKLAMRSATDREKNGAWTLYGTGKFHIQYKDVPVVGEPRLDAPATAYATGKLELEVKEDKKPAIENPVKKPVEPKAKQQKEKEAFTAWGKEIGGLQAGLGYKAGEKRAYSHGETVTLVVRVRNVSKEAVKFRYCRETFFENPPAVTDSKGKPIPLERDRASGFAALVPVTLEPGKEIEVGERRLEIKPSVYGMGKFGVQYERLETPANDITLSKLATGKLELAIERAAK